MSQHVKTPQGPQKHLRPQRVKNYLRTSTQERLCRFALLSIEKDIASNLDKKKDLNAEFAAMKAMRETLK